MKKILVLSLALLAILAVNVLAVNVPASVTVIKSCGINVTAGSPSPTQTVSIQNTGSVPTTSFTVYGTDWSGTGHSMLVGNTSVNDGTSHALPYSSSPLTIYSGVINNGATDQPQLTVSIPQGQALDTYSQTITFTAGC